ncbi:MAG: hypothetical protein V3S64_15075, partial [bacterium]
SDWMPPGSYGTIVSEAFEATGHAVAPPLPVTPPPHNFADQAQFSEYLEAAGFAAVGMRELPVIGRYPSGTHLLDTIKKGSLKVKSRMDGLSAEERERVARAIVEIAESRMRDGMIEIPAKALIGSAVKP